MGDTSFGREERIRRRVEYSRIYRYGVRGSTAHFIWIVCPNTFGIRRLGITASKRTGTAVRRNRIKRLLREFFRLNKARLPESHDIVIIVKGRVPHLAYRDVCGELQCLLRGSDDD